MRNKPKADWHNFDFSEETKLDQILAKIEWDYKVSSSFLKFGRDRISRNTGIRFKLNLVFDKLEVGDKISAFRMRSSDPYIYPNNSCHTNVYESRYNRLECYIPNKRLSNFEDSWQGRAFILDVAFSINQKYLPDFCSQVQLCLEKGNGIRFGAKGAGAIEKVHKYKDEYTSLQIYGLENIFVNFEALLENPMYSSAVFCL